MFLSKSEIPFFWKKSNFQKIKFDFRIFEIFSKNVNFRFFIFWVERQLSQLRKTGLYLEINKKL